MVHPDVWKVVDEAERAQWDYVPLERVGRLSFGMSPPEATAAMEAGGYLADPVAKVGRFGPFDQFSTRFRTVGSKRWRVAVTAYYVGEMGITCIVVDALAGPQVLLDGIRLIGRPPSELSDELIAYLERTGRDIEVTTEGEVGSQALGIYPRAQRAGDVLLTRLVFGRSGAWANTMYDSIPAEEWEVR
jgi:hypothetical protein